MVVSHCFDLGFDFGFDLGFDFEGFIHRLFVYKFEFLDDLHPTHPDCHEHSNGDVNGHFNPPSQHNDGHFNPPS